jgi:hypothetical protein
LETGSRQTAILSARHKHCERGQSFDAAPNASSA